MGKKRKDWNAPAIGARRPMLAIARPVSRSQPAVPMSAAPSISPIGSAAASTPPSGGQLLGLAAYGDSDDDSDNEAEAQDPVNGASAAGISSTESQASLPPASTGDSMDDELLSFMAEIDAISRPSEDGLHHKDSTPDSSTSDVKHVKVDASLKANEIPADEHHTPSALAPQSTQASLLYMSTQSLDLPSIPTVFKSFVPSKPSKDPSIPTRMEKILSRLDQLPAFPVQLSENAGKVLERRRHELEVRFEDWERGALNTSFFTEVLGFWETCIPRLYNAPEGWSLCWDDPSDAYFFVNCLTNEKSWGWPLEGFEMLPIPAPPPRISKGFNNENDESDSGDSKRKLVSIVEKDEETGETAKLKKRKVVTKKPESVSISAKSKKMADMLVKWRNVRQEVKEAEERDQEEDEDYNVEEWVQEQQQSNKRNPNFMPLGPRNVESEKDSSVPTSSVALSVPATMLRPKDSDDEDEDDG
ncbi:hypothetical protein BC829DRAFT_391130 [Chytridium lagenaria]|nr:hypothetical protein BC829DRAFT_391130 [Chytridium lagenaria]